MTVCFKNKSGKRIPVEDLAEWQTLFYKRTPVAWEQRIKSELGNVFLHRFSENACISRLFFIVSEQDGLSGHRDFPWMQLHCNFQGLVAEPNSDRDNLATGVALRLLSSC